MSIPAETQYAKAVTLSGAIELNQRLKTISNHLAVLFQPEFILGGGDDRTMIYPSFTVFWRDEDAISAPLQTFKLGYPHQTPEIVHAIPAFNSTIAAQINETCHTFENDFTPLEQFIPDKLYPAETDLPFDLVDVYNDLMPYIRQTPTDPNELNLGDPRDDFVDDSNASIPFWIDDLNQEECLDLIRTATKHQLADLDYESNDLESFLSWFYCDFSQFQTFIFNSLRSRHSDEIPQTLTFDLNELRGEYDEEPDDEFDFDADFFPFYVPISTLRCAYDQTVDGITIPAHYRYRAYRIPNQTISAVATYADDTQELTMTLTHVPEMIQAWHK